MDTVNWDQEIYETTKKKITSFVNIIFKTDKTKQIYFVPLSGLTGDNVVYQA